MGSAYPTIAADVISRYQRLKGKRVTFLTGVDEHGEKIALAAEKRGLTPQSHCDDIVQSYQLLWDKLDISYDKFVRTTAAQHAEVVSQLLNRVWEGGDIYSAEYEGHYCVDCEEFKADKDMDANKNCPTHRKPCQLRKEQNYFFRLSKYAPQLEALLHQDGFVSPGSKRKEVLEWVREGVRDFSISRAAVKWGIPIEKDPTQTIYVWFDALNGYLSGLLPPGQPATSEALAAAGWPADLHIIGNDILRFHAMYWPGMLISAGLPAPKRIFSHGFLTKDGLKMGKSLGNTLDPLALTQAYGADAVRFYFMKEVAFGADGDFSEQRFRDIVNAFLANTVGNMLNRTLNLLAKNCEGKVPCDTAALPQDHPLRKVVEDKMCAAAAHFDALELHQGIGEVMAAAAQGNAYLDETAPWTKLKKGSEADKAAAAVVLASVLELCRVIAVALMPVTPSLSQRIYRQLGLEEQLQSLSWADTQWGGLKASHATAAPEPIFARLEGDYVTEPAPGVPTTPAAAGESAAASGNGKVGGKKGGEKKAQQQGAGKGKGEKKDKV